MPENICHSCLGGILRGMQSTLNLLVSYNRWVWLVGRVNYRKEWSKSVLRLPFFSYSERHGLWNPRNQFWHPLFVFLPPSFLPILLLSQVPSSPLPPRPLWHLSLTFFPTRMCIRREGGLLNGHCKRSFPRFAGWPPIECGYYGILVIFLSIALVLLWFPTNRSSGWPAQPS